MQQPELVPPYLQLTRFSGSAKEKYAQDQHGHAADQLIRPNDIPPDQRAIGDVGSKVGEYRER